MLFISSKKLFSFSRYSNIVFLSLLLFFLAAITVADNQKHDVKVYDVIMYLSRNLETHIGEYLSK